MNRIIILTALLFCLKAQAQMTALASASTGPRFSEKIFTHTDKDLYFAGEIAWFKIYALDASTLHPLSISKVAYVEIISKERPILQAKIALDEGLGSGSFQLPFSIPSGNYILRVYTSWMKNAGPETFFEKELTILNTLRDPGYLDSLIRQGTPYLSPTQTNILPSNTPLQLNSDKETYSPREKITLSLDGPPGNTFLSMSVVLQDSLQSTSPDNIITGLSQSPAPSGTSANTPSGTPATIPPDYAGLLLPGRITDKLTGLPAANVPAWLCAPGNPFHLAYAVSNSEGNLSWDLGDLYGEHELVVQTAGTPGQTAQGPSQPAPDASAGNRYRIDILSPFYNPGLSQSPAALQLRAGTSQQLLWHSIAAQTQNAWQAERRRRFSQPPITDTTAFFGQPNKRYLLDDYTRFTTMEEVMREYIKEVRVRMHNENFIFNVQSDQANQLFFENRPLILMDGVPVTNVNNIIHFDPLKVRKLEVVTHRYFLGDTIYNGILSYNTYQGDLAGFPLDSSVFVQEYEGLQAHREFYSPAYETADQQESRIPDMRNVLYWAPDLRLSDNNHHLQLAFYASDWPGRYTILLQGITAEGKPAIVSKTFIIQSPAKK